MDDRLGEIAKGGQKGLLLLAELAQHAGAIGEMGTLYTGKRQKLEFNG